MDKILKKYKCSFASIIVAVIFVPISAYLIASSVSLLRTSNSELVGIGASITGFNEFKIVSSIFLAGLLLGVLIVNAFWSYFHVKQSL